MTLQDQPFKNCKKRMPACKVSYLDKYSLIKNNQPKAETPTSSYKIGDPSVKLPLISWLFFIPFNFGYVLIINNGLNKCKY